MARWKSIKSAPKGNAKFVECSLCGLLAPNWDAGRKCINRGIHGECVGKYHVVQPVPSPLLLLSDGDWVVTGYWDGDENKWTDGTVSDWGREITIELTPTHWAELPYPPNKKISVKKIK